MLVSEFVEEVVQERLARVHQNGSLQNARASKRMGKYRGKQSQKKEMLYRGEKQSRGAGFGRPNSKNRKKGTGEKKERTGLVQMRDASRWHSLTRWCPFMNSSYLTSAKSSSPYSSSSPTSMSTFFVRVGMTSPWADWPGGSPRAKLLILATALGSLPLPSSGRGVGQKGV